MSCPYLKNNYCKLVEELAGQPCKTQYQRCKACLKSEKRINLVTINMANRINPELELDISDLGVGVGTSLHNLISPFLSEVKDCGCEEKKDILDLWTPEYIEKNIDRVIEWLADSARKKKLIFSYRLTKILLMSLIKQEHKKATKHTS